MNTKRVFGYLRVSGTGQLDGDGFDRQRDTIQKYCERKGWFVSRWFEEKAVSGAVEGRDRPAFAEMLILMGPATAETIVVERSDRLARDLIISELLVSEAKKLGIQIFEAAADLELTNSDDPTRVLIRQLMAAMAEWEKNTIVKKLRVARMRIRESGQRCEGVTPYEETDRGRPIAWAIIKLHEEKKLGFQRIAKHLNANKAPTALGGKWSRSSVYDIYARAKTLPSVRNHFTVPIGNEIPWNQILSTLPGALAGLRKI